MHGQGTRAMYAGGHPAAEHGARSSTTGFGGRAAHQHRSLTVAQAGSLFGMKDTQWAGHETRLTNKVHAVADTVHSVVRACSSACLDLNPLERARTELKLAPGFLVRRTPKPRRVVDRVGTRSEEHTSELQSQSN